MSKHDKRATDGVGNAHVNNERLLNAKRENRRKNGEAKIRCSDGRTIGTSDFEGKSIHPQGTKVTRATRTKNQAKQRQNRLHRAALYQDFRGENGSKDSARWHTTLRGLTLGTVG